MAYQSVVDANTSKTLTSTIAGLLVLTAVAELVAIWHHPHVQDQDRLKATLEIVAVSHLAGFIHALAIGCSLLIAYCLGELLARRMPAFLFRGAALAYCAGLTALITAATVDGWVLEKLAQGFAHDSAVDLESNFRIFKLCMAWVVASTNVGIVLTSVGILVASVGLLRHRRYWQIAAILGVVVGAALSSAIAAGHLSMDGHGALIAVGLQALWFISVGMASLIRGPGASHANKSQPQLN
jgi:hypothetical protein